MSTRTMTINANYNHVYFSLLGLTFFVLIALYMYFLTMSVVHVVLRKQVINAQSNISSDIAQLESTYIEAQQVVSDKIVASGDLNKVNNKIFINRTTPSVAMSVNIN